MKKLLTRNVYIVKCSHKQLKRWCLLSTSTYSNNKLLINHNFFYCGSQEGGHSLTHKYTKIHQRVGSIHFFFVCHNYEKLNCTSSRARTHFNTNYILRLQK